MGSASAKQESTKVEELEVPYQQLRAAHDRLREANELMLNLVFVLAQRLGGDVQVSHAEVAGAEGRLSLTTSADAGISISCSRPAS
jgi:hypothetical protein